MSTLIRDIEAINQKKIIDTIRCLGIDMIHEANSGHPGIVLGAAPIIYSVYAHNLRFDKDHPDYFNRDRFVMSAGHGSALLYATLFMSGFHISLDDLKKFRQIDSITPGHPEYGVTPGVDCSTGPLGQGFANSVGMAIAEAHLRNKFNTKDNEIIDYYTYCLCGDGDLMEGISYEAASLAGTLKLNKLIVLYDSNNICLDGKTNLTFNDNIPMRFVSLGWNVIQVPDGDNFELINKAINEAKASVDKPTLIEINTKIGKYSKLEGTNQVHGKPLDDDDISDIKRKCDLRDIPFTVVQNILDDMEAIISSRCNNLYDDFMKKVDNLDENKKKELLEFINNEKEIKINDYIYEAPEDLLESPRDTSSKVLNYISKNNNIVIGGSADLFSANKTYINDVGDFSSTNYGGKNIYFGVREHAMGAILNGLALCGFKPYGSTFLAFSDYLRPSIRMACMMNLPVTYIFTHDSISVGEDGPTHQPVEQALGLRSIPNLDVFRPCDANEVIGSYRAIVKNNRPSAILLSRNKLPILSTTNVTSVEKGGYIVFDSIDKPQGIIMSSGEEVHLCIEVAKRLRVKGIDVRVVSIPNIDRLLEESDEYYESILPVEVKKIAVEASSQYIWQQIIYNDKYLITLNQFGCSGKYKDVYKKYGFDVDTLENKIEELLK